MPSVTFTSALTRHVGSLDPFEVSATDVRGALDAAFETEPRLRSYVLDDQGAVRQHVAVFVDGQPIHDRSTLADAVSPASQVHVLQALSGG